MVQLPKLCIGLCSILFVVSAGAQNILTVAQIHKRVQDADNRLQVLQSEQLAADALVEQARVFMNPTAGIELENLGRDAFGVMIAQPLEWAGKRKGRIVVAQHEATMATLQYTARTLELSVQTTRSLILLAAYNAHHVLLDSALSRAQRTVDILHERVAMGATSVVDAMRSELAAEKAAMEKKIIERKIVQLCNALAALWQSTADNFGGISGYFNSTLILPDPEIVAAAVAIHPVVQRAKIAETVAQEKLKLAEREVLPNWELGAGYVRNNERKENSFVVSAAIDIPLLNRYEGAKAEQAHMVVAQKYATNAEETDRHVALVQVQDGIAAIDVQLAHLNKVIIPKTESVFVQLQEYYAQGRVSLLDILASQDEVLLVRTRVLDLHTERALLYADLMALTGLVFEIISEH